MRFLLLEEWKSVVGLEDYAEISNLGRVRTKERVVVNSLGHKSLLKSRIKVGTNNGLGYLQVRFCIDNKVIRKYIHRMVAEAFIGINDKLDVNHKDGNKFNNRLNNLEWCSRSDNIKHALNIGLLLRGKSRFSSPKTV